MPAEGFEHIRTKPYTPQTNGKPNASSRQCCENGPTQPNSTTQTSEKQICRNGGYNCRCQPQSTNTNGLGRTGNLLKLHS